jgi:hypothetical protein
MGVASNARSLLAFLVVAGAGLALCRPDAIAQTTMKPGDALRPLYATVDDIAEGKDHPNLYFSRRERQLRALSPCRAANREPSAPEASSGRRAEAFHGIEPLNRASQRPDRAGAARRS